MISDDRCAFCDIPFGPKGSPTGSSKEHILRKKTLKTLGYLKEPFEQQVFSTDDEYRNLRLVGDTFVASGVCERCNGGAWWRKIDDEAEDLKVNLALGQRTVLDLNDQERNALALWTAKAAYSAIAMKIGRVHELIDSKHLQLFRKDGALPKNSAVIALMNQQLPRDSHVLGHSNAGIWPSVTNGFFTRAIPGYKEGFRLGSLLIGFVHCTAPLYELSIPAHPLFYVVSKNGRVRRRSEMFVLDHEKMPLSNLNVLMSNLSCQPVSLLPPYRLDNVRRCTVYQDSESFTQRRTGF